MSTKHSIEDSSGSQETGRFQGISPNSDAVSKAKEQGVTPIPSQSIGTSVQSAAPLPSRSLPTPVLARTQTVDAIIRQIKSIQEGRLDPRTLSNKERRAVLAILADGRHSAHDLAAILRCSVSRIRNDMQKLRHELGESVVKWTTADAAGFLASAQDRCYAQAMADGDAGLAYSIRSQFVKQLKELGILQSGESREGFRVTVESVGGGLARATEALERAFNPLLSGERSDPRTVEGSATLRLGSKAAAGEDPESLPEVRIVEADPQGQED